MSDHANLMLCYQNVIVVWNYLIQKRCMVHLLFIDRLTKKGHVDVFQDVPSNSVTIGVSDSHIGFIVGRGGRNIMEISQV